MAMTKAQAIYIYDPKLNVATPTDYDYLSELTGLKKSILQSYRSKKQKIGALGCYIVTDKTTSAERRKLYTKEKIKDEVWKTIEGSDGEFLVSNHGRFKRVYKNGAKFLMPYVRKQSGHMYIKVKFRERYRQYKVSHLVAHHYIGPNRFDDSVRHRNGIKADCFSGNLQYISAQKLGQLTGQLSKSKAIVQLDPVTQEWIDEFRSAREAGRQMHISYQAVLDNCHGRTKLAGGIYKFMFLADYEMDEVM